MFPKVCESIEKAEDKNGEFDMVRIYTWNLVYADQRKQWKEEYGTEGKVTQHMMGLYGIENMRVEEIGRAHV